MLKTARVERAVAKAIASFFLWGASPCPRGPLMAEPLAIAARRRR